MMARQSVWVSLAIASVVCCPAASTTEGQPAYQPVIHVGGTVHVWGSPQMGNLLGRYEHGFQKLQPDVHFRNELKSTLLAVPGVYTQRAEIGLLGRDIWPIETQAFEAALGRKPQVVDIATGSYDVPKATYALMIFVSARNPVQTLSVQQLERIFTANERRIITWSGLGCRGPWAHRPIHLYGFSVDNDKAQVFSRLVFQPNHRWSDELHEFRNGSGADGDAGEQIVRAVAKDPDGIGISNVRYETAAVKALSLTTRDHAAPIAPTRENVATRTYPLTRAVHIVVDPDTVRDNAAVREFLLYVLSRQGSQDVSDEGEYLPLPPEIALGERRALSLP